MNIIHWNICGIVKNKDAVIRLIRDFSPHVVMINESLLKPGSNFKIAGFSSVREDMPNGAAGVAVFIKNKVKYNVVDLSSVNIPNRCQIILVELQDMCIIAIYNPPDIYLDINCLNAVYGLTRNKPILFIGDFNAHSPSWGSNVTYARGVRNGDTLLNFIEQHSLFILNDGSATRLTRPGLHSAPDVAICSQQLALNVDFKVLQDRTNSDHFPILCSVNNRSDNSALGSKTNSIRTYNYNKADWEKFSLVVSNKLKDNPPTSYEDFMDIISLSIPEAVPFHKPSSKVGLPWWDNECTEAINKKRQAFKSYKLNPSDENFLTVLRIRAQTRRLLREKKKNGFKNFCEKLSPSTSAKEVWRNVRRYSKGINFLNHHFPLNFSIPEEMLNMLTGPNVPLDDIPDCQFTVEQSEDFEINEFIAAIKHRKNSCPGIDRIPFKVIYHLPFEGAVFLVNFFNKILRMETNIPASWKTQIVIPIPKPGRDPSALSSYRPINLSSCICKTLENMMKNRLEWQMENQQTLSNSQTGFRKGKGVYDNLTILSSRILSSLSSNQLAVMALVDISSAYDNVNVNLLISELARRGVARDMAYVIRKLLINRKIQVKDPSTNSLTQAKQTSKGVPQGSPLSPLLFNIYVDSIKHIIPDDVMLLQYADDFVIIKHGTDIGEILARLNETLQNIYTWITTVGLQINPNKCSAIHFSRKNIDDNGIPNLHINGQNIPWKNIVKYLGVCFDTKLSWEPQIQLMLQKASKGLNMMRSICRTWWGGHPSTLLSFYKAFVRSQLDYGAICLGGCSKKVISQLNKIQFEALRIALGFMKSTPTNVLLGEACEMDLDHRRFFLAAKFLVKAASIENNQVVSAVRCLYINYNENFNFFRQKSLPALVEAFEIVDPLLENLKISPKLPCFSTDLQTLISPVSLEDLNLKKEVDNSRMFVVKKNERWSEDFHFYFTDASKDKEGRVGFGVYCPNSNLRIGQGLPGEFSICSAEIFAINQALDLIDFHNVKKAVIFSDSKSALEDIVKIGLDSKANYITLQTKSKLISLLKRQNKDVTLCWIPSHTGISNNNIADRIANVARLEPPLDIKVSFREFIPKLKNNIWTAWSTKWKNIGLQKGNNYSSHFEKPPTRPWFYKLKLNRKEVTTMCRLRSNHCCCPAHLGRIKVFPTSNCECGELGDITHILFNCPRHWGNSQQLYEALINLKFPSPLHSNTVLFHPKLLESASKLICRFLDACNLKM